MPPQFGATDAELQGLSLAEDDRPPPLPFGIPGAFSPKFQNDEAAAVAAAWPPPLPFDDPGVMPAAKPSTPRRRSAGGKQRVNVIIMHSELSLSHTHHSLLPLMKLVACHKRTHHYTYVNHYGSRHMPRQQSQSVHPRKGGENEGNQLSIFPRPEYFGRAPERATVDATTQRIIHLTAPYSRAAPSLNHSFYTTRNLQYRTHVCSVLRLMFDRVGAPRQCTTYILPED